nr:unnamed protein product [Callosobruchus chinensis]
MTSHRS